jgi:hypothetical protein
MLLLGMKSDLRGHAHQSGVPGTTEERGTTTANGSIVSEQRARLLAEALGAEGYLECSAKQDIESLHKLFKVIAITSLKYTGSTKSDQSHALDRGHNRGTKSAWKSAFGMPATHNSGCTTHSIKGTTWSFWAIKQW